MSDRRTNGWNRREFLTELTLAGTAGLLGLRSAPAEAEPPPETTTLRIGKVAAACVTPAFVAEELLRSEGFVDVQYIEVERYREAQNPWRLARPTSKW